MATVRVIVNNLHQSNVPHNQPFLVARCARRAGGARTALCRQQTAADGKLNVRRMRTASQVHVRELRGTPPAKSCTALPRRMFLR